MIHQALNNRPIGLIGTNIELWMTPKSLQDCNVSSLVFSINIYLFFNLFK